MHAFTVRSKNADSGVRLRTNFWRHRHHHHQVVIIFYELKRNELLLTYEIRWAGNYSLPILRYLSGITHPISDCILIRYPDLVSLSGIWHPYPVLRNTCDLHDHCWWRSLQSFIPQPEVTSSSSSSCSHTVELVLRFDLFVSTVLSSNCTDDLLLQF